MSGRVILTGILGAVMALAQSPRLTGIAHVAFRVADLEASQAFYQKLGYQQVFAMQHEGKTTEAFLKVNDRQYIELYPRTENSQPLGLMHVCYEADDLAAVREAYAAHGLNPPEVRKAGAGNLLLVIRDPESGVIEWTQYMPGSRHWEDRGKHLGADRISTRIDGATFPAKDAMAQRAFYSGKLGFEPLGAAGEFRVPGDSGQSVGVGSATTLMLAVADPEHAAAKLRALGLNPTVLADGAALSDPDGTTIRFTRDYFADWPAGHSPAEVGKRVADHFVTSPHQRANLIIYPEVCAWYGTLTFARVSGDAALLSKAIARFDPLMTPAEEALVPKPTHVDFAVFGSVPLEIYIQTRQQKYLDMGKAFADAQWQDPLPSGLTNQTRFWIDDMFMITALEVQAYRATGESKYLDRAANEMAAYLDRLQQPNGLFYHAEDVPFFWGRGDGWVAVGMVELLRSLPPENPHRARILEGYRKMMKSLLDRQGKDGMWRQLIDHEEAWPESSSTGMFTFAMVTGVKNGWLDGAVYGPAARRAWIALTGYVDQHADVTSVCEGTNKKADLEYYLFRGRITGDMHGQAPVLWSATALLR